MIVIFLDVDGVLNSEDDLMVFREKHNINHCILYQEVEDRPCALLKDLVESTGAKIVLSSTWRLGAPQYVHTSIFGDKLYNKIKNKFDEIGLEIFDITPSDHNKYEQRGDEIRAWLEDHPEVEKFIILDDDSDMCEFTETNLFKTTYKHGLTEEIKELAKQFLLN